MTADSLAETFVEMADTLVDDFDVIEFLQNVTTHATRLVGAKAAGLLLADHRGRLQLMAASDEQARLLELFQVQTVEGPCQDCYRRGVPVAYANLGDAGGRWPRFALRAVEAGFRSVHAFPLRLRSTTIGAVNLFWSGSTTLTEVDARVVQALADIATIGLLQERAVRRGEVLVEQLQEALNSRVVLEQAKGALAQIHGCSTDEAFDMLRTWCRHNHRRLGDVATQVVTDPTAVPELTTAPSA